MVEAPSSPGTSTNGTDEPRPAGIRQSQERWREFLDYVDRHARADWIFRGVDNAAFDLLPGIGRERVIGRHNEMRERKILEIFQKRAGLFDDDVPNDMLELMALAQHHGLPTRLLDWSSNPLVALYFAIASQGRAPARVYAVQASRLEQQEADDLDPFDPPADVMLVVPDAKIRRISNQRGFFTLHRNPADPFDPYNGDPDRQSRDTFDIPPEYGQFFQTRLFYLGINAAMIMDDLDGLAASLRWQYKSRVAVGKISY